MSKDIETEIMIFGEVKPDLKHMGMWDGDNELLLLWSTSSFKGQLYMVTFQIGEIRNLRRSTKRVQNENQPKVIVLWCDLFGMSEMARRLESPTCHIVLEFP